MSLTISINLVMNKVCTSNLPRDFVQHLIGCTIFQTGNTDHPHVGQVPTVNKEHTSLLNNNYIWGGGGELTLEGGGGEELTLECKGIHCVKA